jgi:hypothetical protein
MLNTNKSIMNLHPSQNHIGTSQRKSSNITINSLLTSAHNTIHKTELRPAIHRLHN